MPFSLSVSPKYGRAGRIAARSLERVLGLACLERLYTELQARAPQGRFCDAALNTLNIAVHVRDEDIDRIPGTGPLLVVANHPFGALEGLVLESVVARVRSDVRVLSNYLLDRIPETKDASIFVDPFGGATAPRRNLRPLREAIDWLTGGGALIVFPAGEVAHLELSSLKVVEHDWNKNVARIARRTRAAVLPVFFEGRNSLAFQALGLIHPRLRTAMLPRELLRRRGASAAVRVGSSIPAERLGRFASEGEAIEYLRMRTLMLRTPAARTPVGATASPGCCPVATAESPDAIAEEVRSLPADRMLLESAEFRVFAARAAEVPRVLREIGRLREVTFRQVGEGTGKALDLDRFDDDYLHLFAWDRAAGRLVGAYRLGFVDEIVPRRGIGGLYTSTLFGYDPRLIERLGPAIELGRSFVAAEYQRSYSALLLLWKGIARVVLQNPRRRRLFGVVSISAEYDSMTRRLLMSFLTVNNFDSALARWVRPRTPPRLRRVGPGEAEVLSRVAGDIDEVDALVREIESHRRGVPILLRQYLKLGAKVLGFNIDPAFGNVLDALMLVDLAQVQRPILDRFFGRENAEAFLRHHAAPTQADAVLAQISACA